MVAAALAMASEADDSDPPAIVACDGSNDAVPMSDSPSLALTVCL
jgi:hypothetical protein